MSNLNDFTNPHLHLIKSRVHIAAGINNAGYNTLVLESNTKYIKIFGLESDTRANFTLTLDGSEPNTANTNAFQIVQWYISSSSTHGQAMARADTIIFETEVSGGETLKIAWSSQNSTWVDESSGGQYKVLLEQYSY